MDKASPSEPFAVDLRDYIVFDTADPIHRRVLATDVVAVDLICLEPRQRVPPRTYPTADLVYTVLGGRAWIVTDDAEVTLDPLQSVMIPATVCHGVSNDSPDPLILQVVCSPPDEVPAAPGGASAPAGRDARAASKRGVADRLRRALGG